MSTDHPDEEGVSIMTNHMIVFVADHCIRLLFRLCRVRY